MWTSCVKVKPGPVCCQVGCGMMELLPTIVEWIAAAFGFLCVVLTIRRNIWCWPTGLVQVVLYILVFFHAKLYSDLLLHVVYVIMQFYGWWAWLHGGREGRPLSITRLSGQALLIWVAIAAVGIGALGSVMAGATDASLPYWDAATTVLSLIAQYLLARKVLENWAIWVVVDVLCVGIYLYKALYVTAGLYAVFLVLAVWGFVVWLRTLRQAAKVELA